MVIFSCDAGLCLAWSDMTEGPFSHGETHIQILVYSGCSHICCISKTDPRADHKSSYLSENLPVQTKNGNFVKETDTSGYIV